MTHYLTASYADLMVPLGILTIRPYDAGKWPLPGVLVDTMKKAVGGTTAHKNTNKTDKKKLQILDKDG